VTAPTKWFGSSGVGAYLSAEVGRQWLGTTDAFYRIAAAPVGIPYPSYDTWNVGGAVGIARLSADLTAMTSLK
jgi:hypothetical protein